LAFTYSKLAESTVGAGGASAITFSNIPQNYTDLVIKFSIRSTTTTNNVYITFNGTSTGYSSRFLYGDGAAAASASDSLKYAGVVGSSSETANTFGNGEIYIPNYTSSNNKSLSSDSVSENNATTAYTVFTAKLWSNVTAISSISLAPSSGSYAQYSTATLYGIRVEI
jgi:hypothetical protein